MDVRPTRRETEYFVSSETGNGEYQLVCVSGQWKCTCKAYIKRKQPCKHIDWLLEYLRAQEGGRESEEEGGMVIPPPQTNGTANSTASSISKWVKQIHGKDFIQYEGLLAMAHEKGLQELSAVFISVTADLALAAAHAFFKDGRKFWDAGDATPDNVHFGVKPHFARVALTRAKARVLRDALNIGMVAVEELEE
jgi:hypothetical protein